MALPAGLTWEVRTTGLAINGGAYINLIPGTSVDYSQQNASQLSITDGACLLASVTLTSVIGGFTAGMVGNVIQIRAGGVNFVAGFYEIVLINSANSVNLDRTPVAAGNGTGGLGEVGGALISPETFILNGVAGNVCYVKSGTYNFTASRTYIAVNLTVIGYDASRSVMPTGNNRPLFALGAFFITTAFGNNLKHRNIRFTGSATQLILAETKASVFINCKFENTNPAAGTRYCIWADSPANIPGLTIIDCEFSGVGASNTIGVRTGFFNSGAGSMFLAFNFFHDLGIGVSMDEIAHVPCFIKNIFARVSSAGIVLATGASNDGGPRVYFNSFYASSSYFVQSNRNNNIIYGNTFDSAAVAALFDATTGKTWIIDKNDFWNNALSVLGCVLGYDNIGLNPLWVNPAANDFNFGPGSPNIDQALGIRLGV